MFTTTLPQFHQFHRPGRCAIRFGRQNVHHGMGVAVQGHRRVGLQQLAVQGAEDPHEVVGASQNGDFDGFLGAYG